VTMPYPRLGDDVSPMVEFILNRAWDPHQTDNGLSAPIHVRITSARVITNDQVIPRPDGHPADVLIKYHAIVTFPSGQTLKENFIDNILGTWSGGKIVNTYMVGAALPVDINEAAQTRIQNELSSPWLAAGAWSLWQDLSLLDLIAGLPRDDAFYDGRIDFEYWQKTHALAFSRHDILPEAAVMPLASAPSPSPDDLKAQIEKDFAAYSDFIVHTQPPHLLFARMTNDYRQTCQAALADPDHASPSTQWLVKLDYGNWIKSIRWNATPPTSGTALPATFVNDSRYAFCAKYHLTGTTPTSQDMQNSDSYDQYTVTQTYVAQVPIPASLGNISFTTDNSSSTNGVLQKNFAISLTYDTATWRISNVQLSTDVYVMAQGDAIAAAPDLLRNASTAPKGPFDTQVEGHTVIPYNQMEALFAAHGGETGEASVNYSPAATTNEIAVEVSDQFIRWPPEGCSARIFRLMGFGFGSPFIHLDSLAPNIYSIWMTILVPKDKFDQIHSQAVDRAFRKTISWRVYLLAEVQGANLSTPPHRLALKEIVAHPQKLVLTTVFDYAEPKPDGTFLHHETDPQPVAELQF